MKPVSDKMMDEFEEVALRGLKAMKDYFAYLGKDPSYFQHAKVGAVAAGNYVRLRATEANRMALDVMAQRALTATAGLPSGDGKEE